MATAVHVSRGRTLSIWYCCAVPLFVVQPRFIKAQKKARHLATDNIHHTRETAPPGETGQSTLFALANSTRSWHSTLHWHVALQASYPLHWKNV